MQANKANVVVDLKRAVTGKNGSVLETELNSIQGVSRAQVSAKTGRLVLVDYDPTTVTSDTILSTFVRRGYDARLIGM